LSAQDSEVALLLQARQTPSTPGAVRDLWAELVRRAAASR
jgi:hypothetical protein